MCCFNRPYDDQEQTRIKLETAAKLEIQQHVKAGNCLLLWSAVLDFECSRNPYPEHQYAIFKWRELACSIIRADDSVQSQAAQLVAFGVGSYDALHAASAVAGKADMFVTTDDRLLSKLRKHSSLAAYLPAEALAILEDWYEN
jgi:predicted nucleic acid-binding protein